MKQWLIIGASLAVLVLIGTTIVDAQQQMGGRHQMGGQAGQQEQPSGQPSMMGRGMMGMPMSMPMMCRMMPQMMGAQTDPVGMMSDDQMDPKMMARMLQLRGDMLKAMGEVLLKHGKAMEEAH
jgi:hypothetical protein